MNCWADLEKDVPKWFGPELATVGEVSMVMCVGYLGNFLADVFLKTGSRL